MRFLERVSAAGYEMDRGTWNAGTVLDDCGTAKVPKALVLTTCN